MELCPQGSRGAHSPYNLCVSIFLNKQEGENTLLVEQRKILPVCCSEVLRVVCISETAKLSKHCYMSLGENTVTFPMNAGVR